MSSLLDQGLRHHNAGELAQAEQCYLDVLAREASNTEALKLLAVLAAERNQPEDAAAYIEAAISLKPDAAAYHHLLGRIRASENKFDEAASALQAALAHTPSPDPNILCDLGLCHESLTQWTEAQASFAQVLELAPAHPAGLHGAARAATALGDLQAAKSYYEQALAVDSGNQHARAELAVVLKSLAAS